MDRAQVSAVGEGGCPETGPGGMQHVTPAQARHGDPEPGGNGMPGRTVSNNLVRMHSVPLSRFACVILNNLNNLRFSSPSSRTGTTC